MSPRALLRRCRPVVGQLLLLLAGPLLCGVPVAASSWTYKEGNNGPSEWPGMCQAGTRQSPIDLDPGTAIHSNFEPLVLINYDRRMQGNITNNGHTVMLAMEQNCESVMVAGGLPGVYRLEQIHFHWKSEHTLRSKRWPLEMHIVHYDRKYPKLTDAAKHHQGLAVLAVLFYETKEPNKGLQTILDAMTKVTAEHGNPHKLPQALTLKDLLPSEVNRFYRYAGSLTTPNCDESVVWTVLAQLVPIGQHQVQQFYKVQSHHEEPLDSNYRPIQKLDNRRIYLQQPSEGHHNVSLSSRLHQSWLFVLVLGLLSMIG